MVAAVLPSLVVGWLASAVANRLAFVGWAVVAAAVSVVVVRRAWARGRGARASIGASLAAQGVGFAALGWLVDLHREALEVGGRAVFGAAYPNAVGRPSTWFVVGGVAVAGGLLMNTRRRET